MRSASVSAESSFHISLERAIDDYRGPETVVKNGTAVPGFLVDAFTFLEKHKYYEQEGVFRKEGAKSRMGCLNLVALGDHTLGGIKDLQVIDVCCLVKKFLRSLDNPLLHNLEQKLVSSTNAETVSAQDKVAIRMVLTLVSAMDSKVVTTLSYLMSKLYELLKHEDKTKMGATNLGSMFAPCLFGSQIPPSSVLRTTTKYQNKSKATAPMEAQKRNADRQSRVIEILIQNHSFIGPQGAVFVRKHLSKGSMHRQPMLVASTGPSYFGSTDRNALQDETKKEKRASSVVRMLKVLPKFRRSSSTNRRSSVESASSSGLPFPSLTSKLIQRRPSSHVVALTSTAPVLVDNNDEDVFKSGSFEESPPPLPNSLPPSVETSPATSENTVEYTGFKTVVSVNSLKNSESPDSISLCSHRSRRSSPRRYNVNASRPNRANRNLPLATDLVWPSPAMEPEEMSVRSIRTSRAASNASSNGSTSAYKRTSSSLKQTERRRLIKRNSTVSSTNSADSPSVENAVRSQVPHEDGQTKLSTKSKGERGARRHTAPIRLIQRNQPNTLKNGLDKKKVASVRRTNTVVYKANSDAVNDENSEQLDLNTETSRNNVGFDSLIRPKRFSRMKQRENNVIPMFLDVSDAMEGSELENPRLVDEVACCLSNTSRDSDSSRKTADDKHVFKEPLFIPKRFKSQQRKNEHLIEDDSEEWVRSAAAINRIEQAQDFMTANRPSVVACEASGIVSRRIAAIESVKRL